MDFSQRLERIYQQMQMLLTQYRPQAMAVEKLYFQNNQKTAIDVAQARGVILLAAQQCAKWGMTTLQDVMQTLMAWQNRSLRTLPEIDAYMRQIDEQNEFLIVLYQAMQLDEKTKPNAADRALVKQWTEEWRFEPQKRNCYGKKTSSYHRPGRGHPPGPYRPGNLGGGQSGCVRYRPHHPL